MFVAMNRFRINSGHEEEFEEAWRRRESHLSDFDGFQSFHVLRNQAPEEGVTEFLSYSVWESVEDFDNWRFSADFRQSHETLGPLRSAFAEPPRVSLYTTAINETRAST